MNHPDNNLSIVLKDKNNDYRVDGTRDYFKKYNGAEAIEHWYDSPKLTKDQKIRLIESLQQYIKDGTFNNEDSYDSITSVRKYQLAPMQKSLFDEDLTQPKEEVKEPPKTEETKKKELTDEEVGKVIDTFIKHNLNDWQDFSKNPYKNKTNFTRYGAMKTHREEIKALMGNGEITEEQVNKYSEDRKHFYLKSYVHDIAKTINHLI